MLAHTTQTALRTFVFVVIDVCALALEGVISLLVFHIVYDVIALLSCAILLSKYYQLTCRCVGPGQTACMFVLLFVSLDLKIRLLLVFHVVCMKSRNNASHPHALFCCLDILNYCNGNDNTSLIFVRAFVG